MMGSLVASIVFSGLVALLGPFVLARWLQRRNMGGYWVFFIGALTFAASQLVHVPLLWLISLSNPLFSSMDPALSRLLAAVTLGLAASLSEEWARYAVFRFVLPKQRSFGDSLMHGAGHGGIEAVFVGLMGLTTLLSVWAATRAGDQMTSLVGEQESLHAGLEAFWNTPWYMPLFGTVERLIVVPFHIACSVLVALAVRRRQLRWVWMAILAHTVLDFFAVYAKGSPVALIEFILFVITVVLIVLVARIPQLRDSEESRPERSTEGTAS